MKSILAQGFQGCCSDNEVVTVHLLLHIADRVIMASSSLEPPPADTKPSLCSMRKARQKAARQQTVDVMHSLEARMRSIECSLATVVSQVNAIHALVARVPPPGLQQESSLTDCLARLETILVCSPPSHVEPSVEAVIEHLRGEIGKAGNRRGR